MSAAPKNRPFVLIVDDTPTNIETLVAVLEGPYELFAATSGLQALELLNRSLTPDLILLDVMMAGMDGYEVSARLQAHERWREIPVIFVTAYTDVESEAKALSSGAVDFIHKPINPSVVRARVNLQLRLQAQRHELDALNRELAIRLAELTQANERLNQMAHHDALTKLPNRTLFFDRLRQGLAQSQRHQKSTALMYIDLDGFKSINDTWGHAVGDEILQQAAIRMVSCVRASDTVGRIGGDEFVVLLPQVGDEAGALLVAEKIRSTLAQPFMVAGKCLHLSSSVGMALSTDKDLDENRLAEQADAAMYEAKKGGRNQVRVSKPEAS